MSRAVRRDPRIAPRTVVAKGLLHFSYFPPKVDLLPAPLSQRRPTPSSTPPPQSESEETLPAQCGWQTRSGSLPILAVPGTILFREASTHTDARDHLRDLCCTR